MKFFNHEGQDACTARTPPPAPLRFGDYPGTARQDRCAPGAGTGERGDVNKVKGNFRSREYGGRTFWFGRWN